MQHSMCDMQSRCSNSLPGGLAAQHNLTVSVTGPGVLLGLGNGDPHDHTPEGRTGGSSRRAFDGLLRILVQTTTATIEGEGRGRGSIVVTVSSAGSQVGALKSGSVELPVVAAASDRAGLL